MKDPPVCAARTRAWQALGQAQRAELLAKSNGTTKAGGDRLIACPTCEAKLGKNCNAVRRGRR